MDQLGDELLAGAGFAGDQHVAVGGSGIADRLTHAAGGNAHSNHAATAGERLAIIRREVRSSGESSDGRSDLMLRVGVPVSDDEEIARSGAKGVDGEFLGRAFGEQHHRAARVSDADRLREGDPGAVEPRRRTDDH